MRLVTSGEREILRGDHNVHAQVLVQNTAGEWLDLTNLNGADWFVSATWGEDVDSAGLAGTVVVQRDNAGQSLAPQVQASTLNRAPLGGGSYAPLLVAGSAITIRTAVTQPGVDPATFRTVFVGRIINVAPANDQITLDVQGLQGYLQSRFIEVAQAYGSPTGIPIETTLQQLIDANPPQQPATVVAPVPANWMIKPFSANTGILWEQLQNLAQQIGWVLRYMWNGDTPELRFFNPPRTSDVTDVVWDMGPGEYLSVDDLALGLSDVRTVLKLKYYDRIAQAVVTSFFYASDAALAQYGRQFIEIDENATNQIDTADEATALGTAIITDLSVSPIGQTITSTYFWPVELYDVGLFYANGVHYDQDQRFGVVGYQHRLEGGSGTTTITTKGRPQGAFRKWINLDHGVAAAKAAAPTAPVITVKQTGSTPTTATYQVTVTVGDNSGSRIYLAQGTGDWPAYPSLASGDSFTITRGASGTNQSVRIRAVAGNGLDAVTVVAVDYDGTPTVVGVSQPQPTYANSAQTGWLLTGAVDDNARSMTISCSGTAYPVAITVNGVRTLLANGQLVDLADVKTFVLELSQSSGDMGTLTLTPYEKDDGTGKVGPVFTQRLVRAPVTTATTKDISDTVRQVTLTAVPNTATLLWRYVGASTWNTSTGSAQFNVDLSSSAQTIEFYSLVPSGAAETLQRLTLPQGVAPLLTLDPPQEVAANTLRLSVTTNNNCVFWKLWARMGATPKTTTGTPDDRYLKFQGTSASLSRQMFASTGTWYIVARGYDAFGKFVEQTATITIMGAATSVPALSNLRVYVTQSSGVYSQNVSWDHNDVVQGGGYTVSITRNGTSIVTGRDARWETTNADTQPDAGSYADSPFSIVPAGTAGAQDLTFAYAVSLYNNVGGLVASYNVSYSDHYSSSSGGSVATPTATPPTPNVSCTSATVAANWGNTDSSDGILIEWETASAPGGPWTTFDAVTLPAGTTSTTENCAGYAYAHCRLTYKNAAGSGPVGAWSAPVAIRNGGLV